MVINVTPGSPVAIVPPSLPSRITGHEIVPGVPIGGSTVPSDTDELELVTEVGASVGPSEILINGATDQSVLVSATPEIAVADNANKKFVFQEGVTSGTFRGYVDEYERARYGITASIVPGSSLLKLDRHKAGTLAGDNHTWLQSFMEEYPLAVDNRLFSQFPANPDSSSSFVRSETHYLAESGLDFSGLVAATNAPQQPKGKRGGVLISESVVLWSYHFGGNGVGTKVYFVDNDNNKVVRTIIDEVIITSLDLKLSLLDSPVPAGITVPPLLPDVSSFKGSLGWSGVGKSSAGIPPLTGLPMLWVDGWGPEAVKYAIFADGGSTSTITVDGSPYSFKNSKDIYFAPTSFDRTPLHLEPYVAYCDSGWIGGDSGSPGMVVEGGRLVTACVISGPGVEGSKTFYDALIAFLFSISTRSAETPETTVEAVFSGYTTFP